MLKIFQFIGSALSLPICYVFKLLGYPISEETKSSNWFKTLVGVCSVLSMIYAIYIVPMLFGKKKKKRRYTKKASRRKRR